MNSVVLRKSGGFYICFDDDAIIISFLCNYNINNDLPRRQFLWP